MVFLQTKWQVVAAVLDWLLFGFIWVLTGGTEFVFGAAGDGLHSGREVWVHKIPLCACRSDETLTDSFTDYTNIMLPSVLLLPQLSLKIF